MKRILLLVVSSWLLVAGLKAQTVSQKLQTSFTSFENDPQLSHAVASLYVIDAATGKVIFDKNSQIGLAPASTQKIITSVTAFELLGKDYKYKTVFTGNSDRLYVAGFGDPTLGSWRYKQTKDTFLFKTIIDGLKKGGVTKIRNLIVYDNFTDKILPGGWIYEDLANYYGAGAQNFNWHENQYDITFVPGKKVGDRARIDTTLTPRWREFINNVKTGATGSGDNAYIYFIPQEEVMSIEGTIPQGVDHFTISGADPSPYKNFSYAFKRFAASVNFLSGDKNSLMITPGYRFDSVVLKNAVYTYYSPSLDSIIYWFNKKSINLYGEALIKTFAYEKQGYPSTDSGAAIVKRFWKEKGMDENELNIFDGSGLSPLNRVTTHAQVEILKYARSKDWFPYFYDALPEYNSMKMKSGTIRDVKGFCGYQKAKDGKEYIFSFLVNNYNDSPGELVRKMYKVLDDLK